LKKAAELPPQTLLAAVFMLPLMSFALVELFPSWLYRTMDIASYLVFHNIAEFFSVMVSLSIFGIGWFTYDQSRNRHALFLGCAFLAIGLMDFMHTLGYAGEPAFITPNSPSKSTQFWIAVRMYSALGFLVSGYVHPGSSGRFLSKYFLLAAAVAVSGAVFAAVIYFPSHLPATIIEGRGVTPFKRYSEYLIILLLALSIPAYWKRYADTGQRRFLYYIAAFIFCIFSELAFSGYKSVFDTFNVLGHIYKIIAFILIYQGIFIDAVKFPYLEVVSKTEELRIEIDERKKAADLLGKSEERFRMLAENARDVIYSMSLPDGRYEYVSPASTVLFGYAPEEFYLSPMLIRKFIHPDWRGYLEEEWSKILACDMPPFYEYQIIDKSGETKWVYQRNTLIRDAGGRPVAIEGIATDISERKRSEEMLRLHSEILLNIAEGVFLIRVDDGVIVYANPRFEHMFGYDPGELVGKHVSILNAPDGKSPEAVAQEIINMLARAGVWRGELHTIRKDGNTFWCYANVSTFDHPQYGRVWVTVLQDITERKRSEEELRKLNEELELRVCERTARLQQKSEDLELANERLKEVDRLKYRFIASMSHELRTPLNAVIGFSSILLNEWAGPANTEQKQNLASILRSGRHLLNMINDILDVTQIEAGTVSPVIEEFDLYDLLTEAQNQVMATIREKGLELQSESLHQRMHTDRRRLLQCVLNILSNAAKFTDQGGVTMDAQIVPCSGETPAEEMVEIAVTDTGIGIGKEDQSRIFQPFSRVTTPQWAVPGTGLGLYLTRKIAKEILKGDILVSSEYGKGSRFSLRVPVRLP
jgi:two-component system, cell cycle sensor histidine kinase and response regulator CckA